MSHLTPFWAVGIGGFLGAIARYYLTLAATSRFGTTFPYGTLLVNVSGCLLVGFLGHLWLDRAACGPTLRFLGGTGFLGAYTTLSTFGFETLQLVRQGALLEALANVAGNMVVGLAAVVAGFALARLIP